MNNTNVCAELRIMGDEFDVQLVSKELGISPTVTWNIGEPVRNTRRTYTAWIYSTSEEETLDINTQLKKLEKIFLPKEKILCDLKKQYNLDFSIDIIIVIEDQSPPAIYLDETSIHFASAIGARFDMDTYVN